MTVAHSPILASFHATWEIGALATLQWALSRRQRGIRGPGLST
jgi:hypothetical protein